jgi:hypothetical protein
MQLLRLIASAHAACCWCLLLLGTYKISPLRCCTGVRKTMLPHMPQMRFLDEKCNLGLCLNLAQKGTGRPARQ